MKRGPGESLKTPKRESARRDPPWPKLKTSATGPKTCASFDPICHLQFAICNLQSESRLPGYSSAMVRDRVREEPSESFRGWRRPGPIPPGGVEPEEGETLNYICGHFRIFQYERGHRFSIDDVLAAWYGTQWAPRVARMLDLGSGIGSLAILAAWRLPGANVVTIEAQTESVRLAMKSVRYNGLSERFRIIEGDLRDDSLITGEEPFDLVLGSPPYFLCGAISESSHPQAVAARVEKRGDIADYARAAARHLAPGGLFAFVMPTNDLARTSSALDVNDLALIRRREVIFKEGEPYSLTLFAATRRADLPESWSPFVEPPLVIRRGDGSIHPEFSAIRLSFGYPPSDR